MIFRILGPLEVWDDGARLPLGGPQQRTLLALLLLNANSVVSADRLIDELWGAGAPPSARGLLKGCVAVLRRALGVGRDERLLTRAPGYLLQVRPGERDLDRVEELAGIAKTDASQAAALLREALSCWRGPALDGLEGETCRAEAARIEELRLALLEDRVDAELRRGATPELVTELQPLVRRHPLRERLWAQLMLALHGCDRQADALAVYQRIRRALVTELGVEPSSSLRRAHRLVLAGPAPAPKKDPPATTRVPVPAQLPAEIRDFQGREAELSELGRVAAVAGTAVVSGTAGVGKTALTLRWAHLARERFPDGQLYVDLGGHGPGRPVPPGAALSGFLGALGLNEREIPVGLDDQAARFRTEVAGRRLLVVLDNAGWAGQVRPLLPGTPSCVVVTTSRDSLAGLVALHGARRVGVGRLPLADAIALLRVLIGDRADADPRSVSALAELCARLPLALRLAAEVATAEPDTALRELVDALAEPEDRLELLEVAGDPYASVREGLSWSYRRLPIDAARVFRAAGRAGTELDVGKTVALAGLGLRAARRALSQLAAANMLDVIAPGRYAMHDLLRDYAFCLPDDRSPAALRVLPGRARPPGADRSHTRCRPPGLSVVTATTEKNGD
ncbi:AfsR/SARP family transcriptional regulator [Amycolatopsis japonica]|uniref:AfsR/SARP family transcriptional regulator n=1 Tax=Amycolatopsis japonica TaxID=208439 RepID=UPI0033CA58BF